MPENVYRKVGKNADTFKTCTGISIGQFKDLAAIIKKPTTAGANFQDDIFNRLMMYCLYHHLPITQNLIAQIYGHRSRSRVCRAVKDIERTIEKSTMPGVKFFSKLINTANRQGKIIGHAKKFRNKHKELNLLVDHVEDPKPVKPNPIKSTRLQRSHINGIGQNHRRSSVMKRAKIMKFVLEADSEVKDTEVTLKLGVDPKTVKNTRKRWQEYIGPLEKIEKTQRNLLRRAIEIVLSPKEDTHSHIYQVKFELENLWGGLTKEEWENQNEIYYEINEKYKDQDIDPPQP